MRATGIVCALLVLALSGGAAGQKAQKAGRGTVGRTHPATTPPSPLLGSLPPLAEDGVAVLEYRTAVDQMTDLPDKVAEALSRNTSLRVVGPREGRQRVGARLDADVAACAGEVGCLSRVGLRLGVRSVILVAVSQLGDVVVALQLIEVGERKVGARVADSIPAGQQTDEARILGWLQQLYPPETFKRYGHIRVVLDVSGAQLYINAKARGQTPLREPVQVLAPGNYRLLLEKPHYLPFQASVTVMPDTTVEVSGHLPPEVASKPWYKRWYVWTAIGAGAVAAASIGLAVYYGAFRPEPPDMTHVPSAIQFN